MSQYLLENEGDNIEFTAINTGDYEIFLQHNDNTSANDTEFTKYPDNSLTARKFIIRTSQNVDLVQINGLVFTNPTTIIINKSHTETRNVPIISKIKLRTATANTTIKVRWF